MKKVLIDTNFFLVAYLQKIDIFTEIERLLLGDYEIFVSQGIINELEKVEKTAKKGREKTAAKIALKLIKEKNIKVVENSDGVDEFIFNFFKENSELKEKILCTNDKKLRRKIKKKFGAQIIGIKQKGKLDFI